MGDTNNLLIIGLVLFSLGLVLGACNALVKLAKNGPVTGGGPTLHKDFDSIMGSVQKTPTPPKSSVTASETIPNPVDQNPPTTLDTSLIDTGVQVDQSFYGKAIDFLSTLPLAEVSTDLALCGALFIIVSFLVNPEPVAINNAQSEQGVRILATGPGSLWLPYMTPEQRENDLVRRLLDRGTSRNNRALNREMFRLLRQYPSDTKSLIHGLSSKLNIRELPLSDGRDSPESTAFSRIFIPGDPVGSNYIRNPTLTGTRAFTGRSFTLSGRHVIDLENRNALHNRRVQEFTRNRFQVDDDTRRSTRSPNNSPRNRGAGDDSPRSTRSL